MFPPHRIANKMQTSSTCLVANRLVPEPDTVSGSSRIMKAKQAGVEEGGGGRRTRQLTGATQNVLQTESPVNGVVLREKKVP
jgi:hypothetical protein